MEPLISKLSAPLLWVWHRYLELKQRIGKRVPHGWKIFYQNLTVLRFDVVIAILAFVGGLIALFDFLPSSDPLDELIGGWHVLFNLVYIAAGLGMFIGIGHTRRPLHLASIILLGGSIAIRFIVLVAFFGVQRLVLVNLVFDLSILWACRVCLISLVRGDTLVLVRGPETSDQS